MVRKDDFVVLNGNSLDVLKTLPDKSIACCVTSPPYYGLRDYGTGTWVGGDTDCPHYRTSKYSEGDITGHKAMGDQGQAVGDAIYKSVCPLCGATRVDEQIGIEETPEEYIQRLVEVFREVKRVLKDDGTLWVNIGDTYNTSSYHKDKKSNGYGKQGTNKGTYENVVCRPTAKCCKPKDLIGVPWMLAFALRNDGWWLRQDIIWSKDNAMPSPVKDRFTSSHEYIFLFSKSARYFFDHQASLEDAKSDDHRMPGIAGDRVFEYDSKRNNNPGAYRLAVNTGIKFGGKKYGQSDDSHYQTYSGNEYVYNGKRTKRDVWCIPVSPYSGAHFATYPEQLVTTCVLCGTKEGDTVLDPFNGSGTTGICAIRNGRKYIGIDLNKEYVDLSYNRFDETFFRKKTITEKTCESGGLRKVDLLGG